MRQFFIVLLSTAIFLVGRPACGSQLNLDLPDFGDVSRTFAISADSQWVLFAADNAVDEQFNLFSQRLSTTEPPIQLSDSTLDGGVMVNSSLENFDIMPDGTRAVYIGRNETTGENNLFSALLDGSQPPQRLNIPNGPGTRVSEPLLLTDNGNIVYRSNERDLSQDDLFIVPADGSALPIRISQDFPTDVSLSTLIGLSGGNSHAVYSTTEAASGEQRLFAADLTNLGVVTDLTAGISGPNMSIDTFNIVISSTHVVYVIGPLNNNLVYSATLDGSSSPVLITNFTAGQTFQFGPTSNADTSLVAYMINDNQQSVMQISPVDGATAPVSIPAPNNGIFADIAVFSPDSQRVIASVSDGTLSRLFSFSTDGSSTAINLSPDDSLGLSLTEGYRITSDGSTAVYLASANNSADIYTAPIEGGQPRRINTQAVVSNLFGITGTFTLGDYQPLMLTPDSRSVIYLTVGGQAFLSPLNGNTPPVMLNMPLVNEGSLVETVRSFPPVIFGVALSLTPDQTQFVYRADQSINEQYELFAVSFPPLPTAAEVPALSLWSLWVLVLMISIFGYYLIPRNKSHRV